MVGALRRLVQPMTAVPERPPILRIAVGAYIGTAIANLALTALTDVLVAVSISGLRAQGKAPPAGSVYALLAITGLIALAYSAALVLLALRLSAGSTRARPALLTVSLLSLFVVVTQGPALLLIPLLVGCGVLVTRQAITLWLRDVHGRPPA